MSREIKFRAWDELEKRMWTLDDAGEDSGDGSIQYFSENGSLEFGRLEYYDTGLGINSHFEKFPLMQYTGLKDKHGKEIYEGDIVERKGIKYQITLEIGSFLLVKIDENTDMYEEFVDCWNDHVYPLSQLYWNNSDEENHIYDLEIIGNIYENPELLEATA